MNGKLTPVLAVWFATTLGGSVLAMLALREVAENWLALRRAPTPDSEVLAEILVGNMYQQTGRLVMEGLCWTAGLIVYAAPPPRTEPRGSSSSVVRWMLIGFRVLLVVNNGVEYLSNRGRRMRRQRSQGGS